MQPTKYQQNQLKSKKPNNNNNNNNNVIPIAIGSINF